jgi:hypothetical protein
LQQRYRTVTGKKVESGRRLTEDWDGATRAETTRSMNGKEAGRDERVWRPVIGHRGDELVQNKGDSFVRIRRN